MKHILIFFIELYKKYVSPAKLRPTCKYYPTCSQYAIDALKTHGAIVGSALSLWRILRCNPFSKGGVDYVPRKICFGKNNKRK